MALKKTVIAQNGILITDAYIVARRSHVNDAVSGKEIQIDYDIRLPNSKAGQPNEPNYLFYPFLPALRVDKIRHQSCCVDDPLFPHEKQAIYRDEQYGLQYVPELAGAVQV